MEILKQGNRQALKDRKFICPVCGCVFVANWNDRRWPNWYCCTPEVCCPCGELIEWQFGEQCKEESEPETVNTKTLSIENLVDELRELRCEDLARRALETSDVEWCLSELYDYLHEDVEKVVRCKDCEHYNPEIARCNEHSHFIGRNGEECHPWESSDWKMFDPNYYCADGERKKGKQ